MGWKRPSIRERIQAIDPVRFNEKFRRAWLFYLAGAVETFEATNEIINCFHITFVKGHFARSERPCPSVACGDADHRLVACV
ncbi:MAG: hypothetical protein K0M39_15375 [Rhizobium sp.]|nr:hypothetical protein [Rhizobium sp.]